MQDFVSFANQLADASAEVILPLFQSGIAVDLKADRTPVTAADRDAESLMRRMISKRFPGHGIQGEEFGEENPEAEFIWVLDPIDGTHSFVHGVPLFGTLIALLRSGRPVIGVINLPALNERILGVEGQATTWNGKSVRVSTTSDLEQAVLVTTDHRDMARHQNGNAFDALSRRVSLYRHWGDCYMYTLLARGKVDIALDAIMNPWDIQALIPVVRGAGGTITDYQGNSPEKGSSIIAANSKLHAQVVQLLNP